MYCRRVNWQREIFSLIATRDRIRCHIKAQNCVLADFRVAHSCVRDNCLHGLIKEGVACLTFRSSGMENAKTWNLQLAATRREAIAFRQNNRGTLSSASLLLHIYSETLRAKEAGAIYDQVDGLHNAKFFMPRDPLKMAIIRISTCESTYVKSSQLVDSLQHTRMSSTFNRINGFGRFT